MTNKKIIIKNTVITFVTIIVLCSYLVLANSATDQIFKIDLNKFFQNSNNAQISITTISPTNGQTINNPINFSFNIAYNQTGNLECILKINNIVYTHNDIINLSNGNYNWNFNCTDTTNQTITSTKTGSVNINEGFSISGIKPMYLLKKWNNELENGGTINFVSNNPSSVEYYFKRPDNSISNNATSTTYTINKDIINQKGKYTTLASFERLENPIIIEKDFFASTIERTFPTTVTKNEEVNLYLNIDASGIGDIWGVVIDFGDNGGVKTEYNTLNKTHFKETIKHTYSTSGTYTLKSTFYINNIPFDITLGTITVKSNEDNDEPTIDLIFPEDDTTIYTDKITFKFKVDDNQKIETCNFSVYNATRNSNGVWASYSQSSRVYQEKLNNPTLDTTIQIPLVDFSQRDYAWEVECTDNSTNYAFNANYFEVNLNETQTTNVISTQSTTEDIDYERKEDVQRLLGYANDFIAKEELWSANEKETLETLGLLEEVKFYKKRLLDIEQTLSKNINFIADAQLRETRRQETIDELNSIQEKIPTNFQLEERYEYIKNGNTLNWDETIETYLDETKTKLSSSISDIVAANKQIQSDITVSAITRKVKIDYEQGSNSFILVSKKIAINNESTKTILEIIPKTLVSTPNKIEFISKGTNISGGEITEFSRDELEGSTIVYKINENIELKKLEETDTILFTKSAKNERFKNTLSGFLVLGTNGAFEMNTTIFFIILIIIIIIILLWIMSMYKRIKLKKDPNTYRVIELLNGIKTLLKENNINDARENYKKIQEIYPNLNSSSKKAVIKNLQNAIIAIDRKDIFGLVSEYKKATMKGEKEEAQEIYENVQKIYKRLPEKDRAKVIMELQITENQVTVQKTKPQESKKPEPQEKISIKKENPQKEEEDFTLENEKRSSFY